VIDGISALPRSCFEPARPPALVAEEVSLWYGDKCALSRVCLEVEGRAVTALVGPSGSGKSSFLMCLNRLTDLISSARVTGKIRIGNDPLLERHVDVTALRRRVGMVFQRPTPFPTSIFRNVSMALREHGLRDKARLAEAVELALREAALWDEVKDRLDAPAGTLSGGQQQRLCLARALALEPQILLMDEPCSALDPVASGAIEELVGRLARRHTIVLVTHNLAQARRVAHSVALLWPSAGGGRIIEHRGRDEFFEAPTHELTKAYTALGGEL
jgi:phosphate transport system ATP-binding protein